MTSADLVSAIPGGLVLLVGFFLKRTLNEIQVNLRHALESLAKHDTVLAVHEARIARLEGEFSIQRVKYDDLAGFLQSNGYRKRDG